MTRNSLHLSGFCRTPVHLAAAALVLFQIVCLGMLAWDQVESGGEVIAQESRKCSLSVARGRVDFSLSDSPVSGSR